jgi:alkanesulfonate monooxygenase SsuD/methylene tetrahydromethanopterin reductase-like flavin-dependent oxidoreductase (luciferase family)
MKSTRFGLYLPNFGKASTPSTYVRLAQEAERAGWDGFFIWDHILEWNKRVTIFDAFTTLAAIAVSTKKIWMGTTVTPVPRSKPWIVAKQTATLDNLSNGRLILGVGLGGIESTDYERFGEVADSKAVAEKLDESLAIIDGLWSGRPFSFSGKHYKITKRTTFLPKPVQKPRIPIWVAGFWPRKGPFLRASKWDGTIPLVLPDLLARPDDIRQIVSFIGEKRKSLQDFDVAAINWTTGSNKERNAEKVSSFVDAGVTWWLESLYTMSDSPERMLKRIRLGPSRA